MITNKTTGWVEPTIIINGVELTFAEAMTVRIAISNMRMFVRESSNRDNIGHRLADGYNSHLVSVEALMHRTSE